MDIKCNDVILLDICVKPGEFGIKKKQTKKSERSSLFILKCKYVFVQIPSRDRIQYEEYFI